MDLGPIVARLDALSRRLLLRILLGGIPKVAILGVGLGFATFALDFLLRLPMPVRAVLLLLSLALIATAALRHVLRPLWAKPGTEQLAVLAEASDPALNDQLISAIQLERSLAQGRTVESRDMIEALIADTKARFARSSFASAAPLRPTAGPLLAGALACAVAIGAAAMAPEHASLWFQRQILLSDVQWPQKNRLVVTVVDMEKFSPAIENGRTVLFVPERTPLQITVAAAEGKVLPDEVLLLSSSLEDEGNVQEISLGRAQDREFFQHSFPPLLRSMVFHVVGGDDQDADPTFELRVARAPRITRFSASYEYPDYTKAEARTSPDANLSAPEGTRITMNFEVNMELDEFLVDFEAAGTFQPEKRPDGSWIHTFTLTSNDFYGYRLRGTNGVSALDSPRYVLTVESDQAPKVVVEIPAQSTLLVTPEALIPMKGVVSDDYEVTALELRHGKGGTDLGQGTLAFPDAAFRPALPARQADFFRALPTTSFLVPEGTPESGTAATRPAKEGDRFAFKLLVTDNRRTKTAPEPHRIFSDYEFQVQVLTARDLERELAQRQTRLRDRMQEIATLIDRRMSETSDLRAQVIASADEEPLRQTFWNLEQDQNRITTELQSAGRLFIRVYDGYLWNRVDPSFLTEQMIAGLIAIFESGRSNDPFQIYGTALNDLRPQVKESELLGRLTVILDLMIRCAAERSPEAYRRLALAGLAQGRDERILRIDEAMDAQRVLREDVQKLIDRLEAWEDYLDIIQGLRDIQEIQSGVAKKIEKLTNK